jgi:hypothetical protein
MFLENVKNWVERAAFPERIGIRVAVNTPQQRDEIGFWSQDTPSRWGWNVPRLYEILVTGDKPGVCGPCYELTRTLDGLPGDLVVLASDDFIPPENWDAWVYSQLNSFHGCVLVNDGNDKRACVTLPLMDFACLRSLNKIIYHPTYIHLYSDNELFDVLMELKLLRDERDSGPIFEHHHWLHEKRAKDSVDELVFSFNKRDYDLYNSRKSLPLSEKLTIDVVG